MMAKTLFGDLLWGRNWPAEWGLAPLDLALPDVLGGWVFQVNWKEVVASWDSRWGDDVAIDTFVSAL
jgi:hypothetical protein